MPLVTCHSCGNADDLHGQPSPDGILVTCGSCGHSWLRDLAPRCTLCGSTNVVATPTATLEEAGRGDQRTPSGIRDLYRCNDCGAQDATSASPTVDPDRARRSPRSSTIRRRRADHGDDPTPSVRPPSRQVDSAFGLFAPRQIIGDRWRLARLLRWTSTGSVWIAEAVDSDQQVLFKLVHARLTSDPQRAALYASSASAVATVRHPHLLSVLDVKVLDRHVLVVAEALEGSVLGPATRLDAGTVTRVAGDMAEALAAMHDQRVTHLDIRPEKIFLDSSGGARLIDLGSGRARAAHRIRTAGDDRLAFQAPEQIIARDHGPPADVYGLGLTLWAVAGGDLRQMGVNGTAQASYRLTNNVPPLDQADTPVPGHLRDALVAATLPRPDQRPTAAEFAEQVKSDLNGR